ncbi:MAG: malonyl-CoA decarboxylase family protein [Candidatus Thiodiazotropha sp.]
MNARSWFERMLDNVADRGLELLGLRERGEADAPSDAELCHRLVEGLGEASNIALAREILQRWESMDETDRLDFLHILAVEFDPDPEAIAQAAAAYHPKDPLALHRLLEASEPPRQELMRRLNMAPGGTAALVDIRAFLLRALPNHPELKGVDADFQHLLASWFNRGFLRLEKIDWNSPAAILEKLIRYEAVHPMSGWDDLRRRLGADRRCFAFFHPALPSDPLIFVEVALTNEISARIPPLIDPQSPESDPHQADTAVFYSINNALSGLRGVSFGNFLIKQVVSELNDEFPQIETFITLSPIPRMRQGLLKAVADAVHGDQLARLLGERAEALVQAAGGGEPLQALDSLLQQPVDEIRQSLLDPVLSDLAIYYLTRMKRGKMAAYDPVAHFHLSNGARLERINLHANPSSRGHDESWSCMVNYRYRGEEVVANHEAYVWDGRIALSRDLERRLRQIDERIGNEHAHA